MMSHLLRIFFLCTLFMLWAPLVAAQDAGAGRQTASGARARSDEEFELNIPERQIREREYQASTSVEIGEEQQRGLKLLVGVGVSADEIMVYLRNVRGHVRFRATLERVLERLRMQTQKASP